MPFQGNSFTNHPGVVDYGDKSYFFYHNGALPGGGGFTRSVAVEELLYNADGGIPQLSMTTEGPQQIQSVDPYVRNEAETMAASQGARAEMCSEGGINLGFIGNGDFVKVKGVDFRSGALSFSARVASATEGGLLELHLDSGDGPMIGVCAVSSSGGWQSWRTVSCPVSGAIGLHDIFLVFKGGQGYLFNIDWWQFQPTTRM